MNTKVSALVIGDLMLDNYLLSSCERISPEAPVQVLDVVSEKNSLGGAGNVINNLVSLGSNVNIMSVVGNDDTSNTILDMLNKLGIDCEYIYADNDRTTSKKSRLISSNQQIVRFDRESKDSISTTIEQKIISEFKKVVNKYDVVILSDYAKGVLTNKVCSEIINIANSSSKKVLVDPKGSDYTKYSGAYMLTPNKKEAQEATQISLKNSQDIPKALNIFKDRFNIAVPLITLSEDGISFYDGRVQNIPTHAQEVYDVTGAGDTVIATLAYMLAQGKDIHTSVSYANSAAAVVISKSGSATTTMTEIEQYRNSNRNGKESNHEVKDNKELKEIVAKAQERGNTIVFTNGCFDILHYGHVKYLNEAKKLGDLLIVGVNSDASVKRLKGEKRPINSENDRANIIASLASVDYAVIFGQDTPLELIRELSPDILVKGADYEGKEVVGSELCSEVVLIEFVDGKSTTKIIEKINNNKE